PSASSAKKYTPPRTPWGDPDLQGNYTNKYEQGTPFERPQEFEGRRIEDIQGQELADAIQRRQQAALERDRFLSGDPTGTIAGPGCVGIRIEMIHETRIIPLDNRPHVNKGVSLDMGDPRGHWEGNTLVVETTNFRDRSVYRNANPQKLRLVERFTRTSPTSV